MQPIMVQGVLQCQADQGARVRAKVLPLRCPSSSLSPGAGEGRDGGDCRLVLTPTLAFPRRGGEDWQRREGRPTL
jgi:hypothetical protein